MSVRETDVVSNVELGTGRDLVTGGSEPRAIAFVSLYAIYFVLALLVIVGSVTTDNFLTVNNLLNIGRSVAFIGFVAIGMTFITTSGSLVDLSVPSIIAGAGLLALAVQPMVGVVGGVVVGLAIGALIGVVNGLLVGRIGANPVIATLGTNVLAIGIAQSFVGGRIVSNESDGFEAFGRGTLLGLPNVLWVLAVVTLLGHLVMTRTVFGRWTIVTGGNSRAGRAAGVPVRRVVVSVFAISGVFAALTGVLLAASLDSARANLGLGYEFEAIAAVAVGGNLLFGGAGSIPRSIVGVFIIGVLTNLMLLNGVPAELQQVVKAVVIIAAVLLDIRLKRSRA